MSDLSPTPAFRCTNPRCYRVGTQVPAATGAVCRWPESCARPRPNAFATPPPMPTPGFASPPPPLPRPAAVPVPLPVRPLSRPTWGGCLLRALGLVAVLVVVRGCFGALNRRESPPAPSVAPAPTLRRTVEGLSTPEPTPRRSGAYSPTPDATPSLFSPSRLLTPTPTATPAATVFFFSPVRTPVPVPTISANRYAPYQHRGAEYRLLLPAAWVGQLVTLDNGDKVLCQTADHKRMQLRVRNDPRTVQELYNFYAAEHTADDPDKRNDYTRPPRNGDWFVVSGSNRGRGYYIKGVKRGGRFLFLGIEYDENGPNTMSREDIETISRSFPNG